MDIIPGLITDKEFKYFEVDDYVALGKLLNDMSAKYIKSYMENPDADKRVVDYMENFLGTIIESMTFHFTLQEKGIIDLVTYITPEALVGSDINYDDAYEKLKFLEDNIDKLRMMIPIRNKDDWTAFRSRMDNLVLRMRAANDAPTYPDFLDRLDVNKFVFYKPNEKSHSTRSGIISSKRRQWAMCLRGIEFIRHCESNNIPVLNRRVF